MQKITIQLSEESIKAAIKELDKYKRDINKKVQRLIELMVQHGEDYAINEVGHVDTGETLSSIHGYRDGNKGVVVAGGNAIWLEFGTGIRHNGPAGGSQHPKGSELGMTIGEYGKGQGANPGGWWYYDGDKVRHTYGIEANLFMWKTARELERVAPEMAKEVFAK
jgi:hypothetical protein